MRLDTHTIVATVCPQCHTKLSPSPPISTGICRTRTLTCVDVCACPLSPPPPLCYSSPALFPSLPPFSFPASWPSLSPSLAPLPCASLHTFLPPPSRVLEDGESEWHRVSVPHRQPNCRVSPPEAHRVSVDPAQQSGGYALSVEGTSALGAGIDTVGCVRP